MRDVLFLLAGRQRGIDLAFVRLGVHCEELLGHSLASLALIACVYL